MSLLMDALKRAEASKQEAALAVLVLAAAMTRGNLRELLRR